MFLWFELIAGRVRQLFLGLPIVVFLISEIIKQNAFIGLMGHASFPSESIGLSGIGRHLGPCPQAESMSDSITLSVFRLDKLSRTNRRKVATVFSESKQGSSLFLANNRRGNPFPLTWVVLGSIEPDSRIYLFTSKLLASRAFLLEEESPQRFRLYTRIRSKARLGRKMKVPNRRRKFFSFRVYCKCKRVKWILYWKIYCEEILNWYV